MRIYLRLSSNTTQVPFDYQLHLTGAIHKWLGNNTKHGEISLYSFSMLENGKATKTGLDFGTGTAFFISSYDNEMLRRIIDGVYRQPGVAFGMEVRTAVLKDEPDMSERSHFSVASPVLVKLKIENRMLHLPYSDERCTEVLTQTMKRKLEVGGVDTQGLSLRFDTGYRGARQKLITYRGIKNKANWCPVIIEGTPEAKQFAWNVGVGHSTGIGFGALK